MTESVLVGILLLGLRRRRERRRPTRARARLCPRLSRLPQEKWVASGWVGGAPCGEGQICGPPR